MNSYFVFVNGAGHKCSSDDKEEPCKFYIMVTDIQGEFIKEFSCPANNSWCSCPRLSPSHYPLICFQEYRNQLYLCNPITEWILPLPPLSECQRSPHFSGEKVGFGYLPSTNEYKLVHLFHTNEPQWEESLEISCEVYSLSDAIDENSISTDSWKIVEAKCPHPIMDMPICMDNALHWLVCEEECVSYYSSKMPCAVIVSFDLMMEQFMTMPATTQWKEIMVGKEIVSLYKNESEGKLFILDAVLDVLSCENMCIGAWMVKDYKLGTWEKVYNIDLGYLANMDILLDSSINVYPVCHLSDENELVMICVWDTGYSRDSRIMYYNISTECFRTLEDDDIGGTMGIFKGNLI